LLGSGYLGYLITINFGINHLRALITTIKLILKLIVKLKLIVGADHYYEVRS